MCEHAAKDRAIDFEKSVELIEESEVVTCLDLGHSLLYRLMHPVFGAIAVLNSSVGSCAVMNL